MSKNLENEYKEMMKEELPDLWDRIETELDARQSRARRNLWRRYAPWGGLAAVACLCLVFIVPVALGGKLSIFEMAQLGFIQESPNYNAKWENGVANDGSQAESIYNSAPSVGGSWQEGWADDATIADGAVNGGASTAEEADIFRMVRGEIMEFWRKNWK